MKQSTSSLFTFSESLVWTQGGSCASEAQQIDWAMCIREMSDRHYLDANLAVRVIDTLNTYTEPTACIKPLLWWRPSASSDGSISITRRPATVGCGCVLRQQAAKIAAKQVLDLFVVDCNLKGCHRSYVGWFWLISLPT
jgi:hypothetical protein